METCTFRCFCGQTVDYLNPMRGCHNVGHITKVTEWHCLFLPDGETTWLCPICARYAKQLAHKLVEVVGVDDVRLNQVLGLPG